MTQLVLLLLGLHLGDTTLLRYRLPDAHASAVTLGLGQNDEIASPGDDYGGFSVSPGYQVEVLGERVNLSASAGLGIDAEAMDLWSPGWDRRQSYLDLSPALGAGLVWLPFRFPIGLALGLDARTDLNWMTTVDASDSMDSQRSTEVSCLAAIGPSLGRFRDAQPVIQALRVCEILEQEGQTMRARNADDIEALAQLIARRPLFGYRFIQPNRVWFGEIESLLRSRGLTAGRVPARVWFKIREVFDSAVELARPVGYRLSIGPGIDGYWSRTWLDSVKETNDQPKLTWVSLQFASGYPLSRRWQFTGNAGWQITSDHPTPRHYVNVDVGLDYHVFDQLLVGLSYAGSFANRMIHYTIHYTDSDQEERWDEWNHALNLGATWYREDQLSLTGSLGLTRNAYRKTPASEPRVSGTGLNLGLWLSYRLAD